MTLILWTILVGCGGLVLYPYLGFPLILRFLPTKPIARNIGHRGRVTMMFCAFNEGQVIAEKLRNIARLKARYPELEVLAYDDGSSDDTCAQLEARPDLVTVLRGAGRCGKAHGMKRMAAQAQGDILVFTDANVLLDEAALDNLMAWYGDPNVGGVCGTLKYLGEGTSATASVGGLYWRLEERIKAAESRSGNVMGADGSIFSVRRELYPSFPDTVLDDMTVSMAVVFAGKRLIKVEDVVAYERLVSARSEEFRRKMRIAARAYHTHRHLAPKLGKMAAIDVFKYVSHKVLRWFGGLFLMMGALAFVGLALSVSWLVAGLGLCAVLVAAVMGFRAKTGTLGAIAEIILALVATQIGVFKAMRGQVVVTWAPAKSR